MIDGFDSIASTKFKLGAINKNITEEIKLGSSPAVLAKKYIDELNQCFRELAMEEMNAQEFEDHIKTMIPKEN